MKNKNTKIILIRHGESLANAERIYLGHTDWDLSPLGKRQAEIAAESFSDEKIDFIYSSDLIRAYNTALPFAKMRGMEIIKSTDMREINLGKWEGLKLDFIEEMWHDEFIHGWKENFGTFTPPEGESIKHLSERIYKEIFRIGKLHPGKTVLIATHAAAIRSFWGLLCGIPYEELAAKVQFPPNASATTVEFDGERLIPIEYGRADYLSSGGEIRP